MTRTLLVLCFMLIAAHPLSARAIECNSKSSTAFLQAGLEISCSASQRNAPLKEYTIYVRENDTIRDTIFADLTLPVFIQLELNKSYLLEFSKPGFLERLVLVDTKVPNGKDRRRYTYEFEIDMPFIYSDTGSYAIRPIARIIYDQSVSGFSYDLEYAKSIGNVPTMTAAPDAKGDKSPAQRKNTTKISRRKL
jgi:hypothetical protein